MKNSRRFFLNWGIKFIGIILLIALLRRIDITRFFKVLKQFRWSEIILLEIISAVVILTKALRFKILAGKYSVPIDLKKSTIIYGSSMFFSTITPGRVGDFIKIFQLKNLYHTSLPKGAYLSIVDRIFDLLTIALVSLFGLALIIPVKIIIGSLLIGLILVFSILILGRKYLAGMVFQFVVWVGKRLKFDLENVETPQLFSRRLVMPGLFSLIPNGLIFLQMILIAKISRVAIQPLEITGILALGNLISMLPVTISGLGTRDATFVYLLAKQGIPSTQALTLSLSFFLFNNLGILFFGLLLFLIFKPKMQVGQVV